MVAFVFSNSLPALQADVFRFLALYVLPLWIYVRLQAETLKRMHGPWKLVALAPGLLMSAVVYVLTFEAVIALVVQRRPGEDLFVIYVLTGAACSAFLCAMLVGRKLARPPRSPARD